MSNPMRNIRIAKLTLNIGTGKDEEKLKKGMKLLATLSGVKIVKAFTVKKIPGWGVRPGLPLGCKTTIRGKAIEPLLKRLLNAKTNKLPKSCVDDFGNVSFGVEEYINIPEMKYDPAIGMMGLEVSLTLERPGFRVKRRRIKPAKITSRHKIKKEDAIAFMQSAFSIKVTERGSE